MSSSPYPDYLGLLISGHWQEMAAFLGDNPVIDDPNGRVSDKKAVSDFLRAKSQELQSKNARAERLRLTTTPQRAVDEQVIYLIENGREIQFPYAIVIEGAAVRVYYSHWPLIQGHRLRAAILQEDKNLSLSDAVEDYQRALGEGSVVGILAAFEDDGYAREPAGSDYIYRGKDALRKFYTGLFSFGKGGGIPLQHCTVTDDGAACAVEYNVVELGGTLITPQAGVAVYERASSGKLHAARIYDDISME